MIGSCDVKALLSIYEASYLALESELDLHEAKLCATKSLLKQSGQVHKVMHDHIIYALDIPLYHRMQRLQARWYIDAYGKRKDANKLLLELAILDFNMVQSENKKDLQQVSK
ncbi:putative (E)-beta-ocimene synthase [Helianthus annuus]|nr:putative (E)-beta-ocimene synthase [Helianthus annuus]